MTLDDLDMAIAWLRSYENTPNDDGEERCERVAVFLETERRRYVAAASLAEAIRQLAAERHVSPTTVRKQLAAKRRQAHAKEPAR